MNKSSPALEEKSLGHVEALPDPKPYKRSEPTPLSSTVVNLNLTFLAAFVPRVD